MALNSVKCFGTAPWNAASAAGAAHGARSPHGALEKSCGRYVIVTAQCHKIQPVAPSATPNVRPWAKCVRQSGGEGAFFACESHLCSRLFLCKIRMDYWSHLSSKPLAQITLMYVPSSFPPRSFSRVPWEGEDPTQNRWRPVSKSWGWCALGTRAVKPG